MIACAVGGHAWQFSNLADAIPGHPLSREVHHRSQTRGGSDGIAAPCQLGQQLGVGQAHARRAD